MTCCERAGRCSFFREALATMPMIPDIYKDYYCRGNSNECAIHLLAAAAGEQWLPSDLFPNQTVRAQKLIAQYRLAAAGPVAVGRTERAR